MCNFRNLNHMNQVCAESYEVGCMNQCSMIVVIHPTSHCALTAPTMTRMTLLTYILLERFISNLVLVFWLNSNWQDGMKCIGHQTMSVGVSNIGMAHATVAHPQTNDHVSQLGPWNQVNADTMQSGYMSCFSKRYIIKNITLPIHSSDDTGAVTISSSESEFHIVISSGRYIQG